jgi:L-amino acid N-acyltransferase YncA
MIIRAATLQDIPEITALYAHHVLHGTATFETEPPSESEMLSRFEKITGEGNPYFVAEIEGKVLGYSYAGLFHPRFAFRFTCENSIYIHHAHTKQGIGKALLEALLEACVAKGYRQMIAVIGDNNNAGSINLHASLGFQHQGLIQNVGWKHGMWLDVIYMQKALGKGETTFP